MKRQADKPTLRAGKTVKVAPLKPNHEQFAQNWVANGGNGRKAAEDAGFAGGASAEVAASRLLRNVKVRARIAELESQSSVTSSEVVGLLASQMRGDVTDALDPTDPAVIRLRQSGVSHLIKKIKFDSKTGHMTEIEFYDAQAAARTLGKYKGLEQQPRENDAEVRRKRDALLAMVNRLEREADEAGEPIARREIVERIIRRKPETAQYLAAELVSELAH